MTQTAPVPEGQTPDLNIEDPEDALLEGDRTFTPGTAASALRHRDFRYIYFGAFTSNIGTWMQNVVLGALAYELSDHSALFVGLIMFAQLGPLLLLSMVGGMLADTVDRKKLLVILTLEQAIGSIVLAFVVLHEDSTSLLALFLVTLAIGIGNALYAPTFSAILPILVPREDMGGAISLNSAQMNGSRVIGPAIGSFLYAQYGASWVFVLNAVSYAAIIVVLLKVALPQPPPSHSQGLHRLLEGVTYARRDPVVARCLVIIFVFSLASLPFITQLPTIAGDNLHISPRSIGYGLLYGAFGLGAVVGALSIGTVFAGASKAKLTRIGLLAFAAFLAVFAVLGSPAPAYPVIFGLGAVYFAVITSLSTVLQQDLDDSVRGKVMALWIMGFGGTVPIGGLIGGVISEQVGITAVALGGAVVAVGLAAYAQLERDPAVDTRVATVD